VRCRLCGHAFDAAALACHGSCPLGARCTLICCPNCGYQVVDESRSGVARLLRRVLRATDDQAADPPEPRDRSTVPLSHVREGAAVEVHRFEDMSTARLSRLTGFGLAPGTVVTLRQRRPVPVVAIGETELALSEDIARRIHVHVPREA
jgi:Fe2+ transport system protein FeoA